MRRACGEECENVICMCVCDAQGGLCKSANTSRCSSCSRAAVLCLLLDAALGGGWGQGESGQWGCVLCGKKSLPFIIRTQTHKLFKCIIF